MNGCRKWIVGSDRSGRFFLLQILKSLVLLLQLPLPLEKLLMPDFEYVLPGFGCQAVDVCRLLWYRWWSCDTR